MTAEDDALGFAAAMHEESTRQLAQLRVTLEAKKRNAQQELGKSQHDFAMLGWAIRAETYREVLSLLGPEPAWSNDNTGEPF